jgi:tripartite ATP-independent transporter DctM subunit
MVEAILLFGVFFLLLIIGMPVAYCLGIAAVVTAIFHGDGVYMLAQKMTANIQVEQLMAIPLFILAGSIMAKGGVARRIVDFAYVLVGWMPGGLAIVNCVDSMFFGGVSGSSIADIASTGPIMIPMMVEKGYDREFSTAITVASSTQGIIIPPSHNMVIYAMVVGGVSVGKLFLAGYIPGVMLGVFLAITCFILALIRKYPREKTPPLKQSLKIIRDGILSMLAAVLIIGGIALGIFTATEASAIAVVYTALLGFFVYRELKLKDILPILKETVRTTAIVFFLIGTASAFGYMMTILQIPTVVTNSILSLTSNPILILFFINILLLILGCIMDVAPLILIVTPVLLPVVKAAGMSPITFGIVLMVNLAIGLTTPPVGAGLFVGCTVGKTTLEKCSKAMLLLWPAMLAVLFLVTYVPWFTTFLPDLAINAK